MQYLALWLLLIVKPLLPVSIRAAEGSWLRKRKLQTVQPNYRVQTCRRWNIACYRQQTGIAFHMQSHTHIHSKAGCLPMLQNQVIGKKMNAKRAQKDVYIYPQPFLVVSEGILGSQMGWGGWTTDTLWKLGTCGFEVAGNGERHDSSSWAFISLFSTVFQEIICRGSRWTEITS